MRKLFVFNKESEIYFGELEIAFIRISSPDYKKRVDLNELTVSLLESEKIDIVIANDLPHDWISILRNMQIVCIVFGDAVSYYQKSDIVIDFRGTNSLRYLSGSTYSMNNKDFDISSLTSIVSKLSWDSEFFGFPIAFVSTRNLTYNLQLAVEKYVKRENIKLIQYLSNCHDDLSVRVAENHGYHFTDIRLRFSLNLKKYNLDLDQFDLPGRFGLANASHIQNLMQMTNMMYKDSRYFFDGNFELEKINKFYSDWIRKSVIGEFDHECYCYFENEMPLGFCTIRYEGNTSSIGLFGVDSNFLGRGIGNSLLKHVIEGQKKKGIDYINVVTQGRNYAAQKLYQSVGFRTFSTELWYHKWY